MAITLNKYAAKCERMAITSGEITSDSSPRTLLYSISRNWRVLLDIAGQDTAKRGMWTAKEEAAGEVIVSTLTYLRRIGCNDVERLLKDIIERNSRSPV